ncbi:hypothetical protein Ddc_18136 [Ditylenchus destructor]|nr:hypothetical protein Ddc_18136 [Ditylenchus destructor]
MDENNIFNSFSFQKWASFVKHIKIDEEILKQRMEQISRLRLKLIRERTFRKQADILSDNDIDKLIEYICAVLSSRNLSSTLLENNHLKSGESMLHIPKDDDYVFKELEACIDKTSSSLHDTFPLKFKCNYRYKDKLGLKTKTNEGAREIIFEYNRRATTKS